MSQKVFVLHDPWRIYVRVFVFLVLFSNAFLKILVLTGIHDSFEERGKGAGWLTRAQGRSSDSASGSSS